MMHIISFVVGLGLDFNILNLILVSILISIVSGILLAYPMIQSLGFKPWIKLELHGILNPIVVIFNALPLFAGSALMTYIFN